MSTMIAPRPAHVPPELVVDFDFRNPPGIEQGDDVYQAWSRLYEGPDIFWTPRYGGHWVLTRAADVNTVQKDFAHFSHKEFSLPRGSAPFRRPPIEIDPPDHAAYRSIINPLFSLKAVREVEPTIRKVAVEAIEKLKPQGRCEFVNDFARLLPSTVFIGLMKLPMEDREKFLAWSHANARAATVETKQAAFQTMAGYMKAFVEQRENDRRDDFISTILNIRDEGKRMQHPEDILGMLILVMSGGLDTVANMISFTCRFLAKNPGHQQRLRDEPEIIPQAVEEFIRRHGLSNTIRIVTEDMNYKGVLFKNDDAVMVPICMSSMDAERYDNPLAIDFDRNVDPHTHDTFGNGPHRCPGATLARTEIIVFLEEWLGRIPSFKVDPDDEDVTLSGTVNSVQKLPLVWAV